MACRKIYFRIQTVNYASQLLNFISMFIACIFFIYTRFEKENINTLTESSEFLITLFSGFAQAESESQCENVIRGKQFSMREGIIHFQYKKLLGYRRGEDGQPEIVPEEAETIRVKIQDADVEIEQSLC